MPIIMKVITLMFFLIVMVIWPAQTSAQLPYCQIYTMQLKSHPSNVVLDQLQLVTHFHPQGYNNQPYFIDDSHLLIASDWQSRDHTDIWQLDLINHKLLRITATSASEYSPTVLADSLHFTVIRQHTDDPAHAIQVLWSYPIDRSHTGQGIVMEPATIGYHAWLTPHRVALYLVGDPNELIIYDTQTSTSEHIAYHIGRSLKTNQEGELFYIQKIGATLHIRKYDPSTKRSILVTTALDGQEDFDILPNGFLLAGYGSKLMVHRPGTDHGWHELLDLSTSGVGSISRIACSEHKIAFVTTSHN